MRSVRLGGAFLALVVVACSTEPAHRETLTGGAQLAFPSDLAVDANNIWIADTGNDRVTGLDHSFGVSRIIGRSGSGPGELKVPMGVATAGERVFVSDLGNSRISQFRTDGEYLDSSPFPNRLVPFALTPAGELLVPGTGNRPTLMKWRGGQWIELGSAGVDVEAEPSGRPEYRITVASDASVWILNAASGRLWRFDEEGRVVGRGELPTPYLERLEEARAKKLGGLQKSGHQVVNGPLTKGISSAGQGRVLIHLPLREILGLLAYTDGDGFGFADVRIRNGLVEPDVVYGSSAVRIWRDELYLLSDEGVFVFHEE